jgi:hypothetical protein
MYNSRKFWIVKKQENWEKMIKDKHSIFRTKELILPQKLEKVNTEKLIVLLDYF